MAQNYLCPKSDDLIPYEIPCMRARWHSIFEPCLYTWYLLSIYGSLMEFQSAFLQHLQQKRTSLELVFCLLLPSLWGVIYLFAQTLRIGMLRIPLSSWWMDLQSVLADAPVIAVTSFKSEVAAQEWHSSPGSMALGSIFLLHSKWALTLQIACLCQPM